MAIPPVFRGYRHVKSGGLWEKRPAEPGAPGVVQPLVAGNWKMNKTPIEGGAMVYRVLDLCRGITDVDIVFAPPFTGLYTLREFLPAGFADKEYGLAGNVYVAAQDVFFKPDGPYTGEISPRMLKAIGIDMVIVGHSDRRTRLGEFFGIRGSVTRRLAPQQLVAELERLRGDGEVDPNIIAALALLTDPANRHILDGLAAYLIKQFTERTGETEEVINKKTIAVVDQDLTAIFCCGENLQAREGGRTFQIIKGQIVNGLAGIAPEKMKQVIIAYEPVWAIGTGQIASVDKIAEVHAFVRDLVERFYGEEIARFIRILYGGSVKPDNMSQIMGIPNVDGVLVGGSSLEAADFAGIIRYDLPARAA